jgi:Tfp pilus assembly protein PilZ
MSKIFGPHRAVSIYVFLQNRGLALLALAAFVIGVSALLILNRPEKHEHMAFLTVPVITTTSIGNQLKNGLIVTIRLPDGEALTVTTTEGEVAATVTATACVEKRRFVESGKFRYRIKLPHYCAAN